MDQSASLCCVLLLAHTFALTMARKRKSDALAANCVPPAPQETVTCNDESAAPLSEEEKKKREKAIKKLLKKESDLRTIVDANKTSFGSKGNDHWT